jgi:hypothetical protein
VASRVDSSGITFITTRLTAGALRQYPSNASRTSLSPALNETNLYEQAVRAKVTPNAHTKV